MTALAYRRATESDLVLVVSSWVDSYRTSHAAGLVPMPYYRQQMTQNVRWVLARPGVEVLVACHPEEQPPHDVYGWLCHERGVEMPHRARKAGRWVDEMHPAGPVVHYVNVKEPYRRMGVARGLLREAGIDPREPLIATCKTGVLTDLRAKAPHVRFNPLIARYPRGGATQEDQQ